MHLQPVFASCEHAGGNVAEALFRAGLCLPSGTALGEEDLARVAGVVRGVGTRRRGDKETRRQGDKGTRR